MLRQFRIAVAIMVFVALTLFFLDFTETIPLWVTLFAKLQFFPALMGAAQGIALSVGVLAILILLTLLFGRVYCSFLCPLGILQDIVARMARFRNHKKRYAYRKPFKKTRRTIFLVILISVICGWVGFFSLSPVTGLLDPYACYGRIVTHIALPIYSLGNNLLATMTRYFGNYYFYLVESQGKGLFTLVVAVISFLTVGILAWRSGRLYCNSICPVGTLLGFLSRRALFKIRIDAEKCVGCKLCERVCKGGCLDAANGIMDADRCVVCLDCLSVCRKDAISYNLPLRSPTKVGDEMKENSVHASIPDDPSKRRFLKGTAISLAIGSVAASSAGKLLAQTAEKRTDAPTPQNVSKLSGKGTSSDLTAKTLEISDKGKVPYKIKHAVSPPGALGLKHLMAHCTGCHLCVAQCPTNVIKPAFFDYGLGGMMLPVMKFSTEVYCNFDCVRCGEVCPTGAIRPLSMEAKHATQIGRVLFIKENCIVFTEETNCGACAEHCPTQAVQMIDYKGNLTIPETREAFCVGCGACESICPVIPFKAIHVEGNVIHQTAEKPPQAEKIDVELDDFGF